MNDDEFEKLVQDAIRRQEKDSSLSAFPRVRPKRHGMEPWRPGKVVMTALQMPLPDCPYDKAEIASPSPIETVRATDAAIYKMMGKAHG